MTGWRKVFLVAALSAAASLAPGAASAQSIVAAVLPTSRAVVVNTPATAFATIINTGVATAADCGIALPATTPPIPAMLTFHTTNPSTNEVVGPANALVSIPGGGSQTFVFAITPSSTFAPSDIFLVFRCANTPDAPSVVGLNTFLLSSSPTPVADVVALAATVQNNGIVDLDRATGQGAFAVATSNVGAGDVVAVHLTTASSTVNATVTPAICQTNPATGACMTGLFPNGALRTALPAGTTATFAIFLAGRALLPFDPAGTRIQATFIDSSGLTRGATSVAVRTVP